MFRKALSGSWCIDALYMYYVEDVPPSSISRYLGVSTPAVRGCLSRVRGLRGRVSKHVIELIKYLYMNRQKVDEYVDSLMRGPRYYCPFCSRWIKPPSRWGFANHLVIYHLEFLEYAVKSATSLRST